jgi:hypothetical protein
MANKKKKKITKSKSAHPKKKGRFKIYTIVTLFVTITSVISGIMLFSPKIDITLQTQQRKDDPFTTPFVVKNTGLFSVKNIKVSLHINKTEANSPQIETIHIENSDFGSQSITIPELKRNEDSTFFLPLASVMPIHFMNVKYATIEASLNYSYFLIPHTKTFYFKTFRDHSGCLYWIPKSESNWSAIKDQNM